MKITHFECHMLMSAYSSVEEICRRHSCSDCPLGPQDDHGCAFTILKNILEKTNNDRKDTTNL